MSSRNVGLENKYKSDLPTITSSRADKLRPLDLMPIFKDRLGIKAPSTASVRNDTRSVSPSIKYSSAPKKDVLESLKQKLAYEWKNIYRQLCDLDKQLTGSVTMGQFAEAVNKSGSYLTKEDI